MNKVLAFLVGVWVISSCSSSPDNSSESANNLTDSLYRPTYHFSPEKNWMGAPISMIQHGSEYHLFYEYNRKNTKADNNSWGHAVSTDMLHWKEWQPIFQNSDERQGSVVSDITNTSGFGENALIAIFNEDDEILLSYSLDNGTSWTDYSSTLLELSGIPKISRHPDSNQWIMTLLEGKKIILFSSSDLVSWSQESELTLTSEFISAELFSISEKWGLLLNGEKSVNYLIGDFDGVMFAPLASNPNRFDLGNDNSFGTIMKTPDRSIYIGWMNHESYANDLPTSKWKSSLTLPRTIKFNSQNQLTSFPIEERKSLLTAKRRGKIDLLKSSSKNWYSIEIDENPETMLLMLTSRQGENFAMTYDAGSSTYGIDRSKSGVVDFHPSFKKNSSKANSKLDRIFILDVFIDRSSVEIFINEGEVQITSLFFSKTTFNSLELELNGKHINVPAIVYDLERKE